MKPEIAKAVELAYKVRKAAERYQVLHSSNYDEDLRGLCGIASMALVGYLRRNKIKASLIMGIIWEDDRRERTLDPYEAGHCWVEVPINSKQNQVIDITMTQFKDCDKVYLETIKAGGVASRSRGYKNFRRWGSDRATPSTTAKMLSLISEKE